MGFDLFNPNTWNAQGQGGGFNVFQPSSWGGSGANPSQFAYGAPGAAQQWENQFGQTANDQQAAAKANQAQLGQFYMGQLNGTGPSLAAQQAKASTDQSIAAQQATAASARGSLGQAGAQMQAAGLGAQARQQGAQNAVMGRIGEEYNAAQGLGSLAGQQQQGALGWTGYQQGAAAGQLGGNEALAGANQAQNATTLGLVGSLAGAAGSAAAGGGSKSGDADLEEPGGGAHQTLREEDATGSHPGWILAVDHQTGHMGKVRIDPLTPEEHAQARGHHGAGPIGSPQRTHTTYHDLGIGGGTPDFAAVRGQLSGPPATGPQASPGGPANPFALQLGQGAVIPASGILGAGIQGTPINEALLSDRYTDSAIQGNLDAAGHYKPPAPDQYDPSALITGQPTVRAPPARASAGMSASAGSGGGPVRTGFVSTLDPSDLAHLKEGQAAESAASGKLGPDLAAEENQAAANSAREAAQIDANTREAQTFEGQREHEAKQITYHREELAREADKLGGDYGWHPSTATKVRYGIANFLGAFGASLAHTQNFAMQQINDNIGRELDEQAKKIESAKGRVADQDTLLAQAYRQTGDMRQAKTAAALASLDKVRAEGQAFARATHSRTVLDNQAALDAQLEQKQAEILGSHLKMVQTGGGDSGAGNLEKRYQAYVDRQLSTPGGKAMTKEDFARALGGAGGSSLVAGRGAATSQRDAESIRAHETAIANIDKLLALRDKHGGGSLSPNDRANAEAIAARTQENLVAALGKTNKGLLDRTSHLVPDQPLELKPSGLIGSDEIGTRLRSAKSMLQEELNRTTANPGAGGPGLGGQDTSEASP